MLSFDNGTPIAIIRGGKLDGELIFVKRSNNTDKEQIQEIVIPDGKLEPIPSTGVSCFYSGGPQDSGKSTACANWTKIYLKTHPGHKAHMFKRNSDYDKAYEGIKINDIPLSDVRKYKLGNLGKSIVIFDDITRIPNKSTYQYLYDLLLDLLENGRKAKISIACTNHLLCDRDRTKVQLNECNKVVVFPGQSNHQIEYVCKFYFGMKKSQIERIIDSSSWWVLISTNAPRYIIYESGCYIL